MSIKDNTKNIVIPEMHDWTLSKIELDWPQGDVTLTFRDRPKHIVLWVGHSLMSVSIPRMFEWGESASILSAKATQDESKKILFEIDMQSGDKLQIYVMKMEFVSNTN